ncbi:MAG: hypothetical protein M1491_00685 [Deltaproteobacteria bacterium]|nr:hypothetical protein [Deltaproteobacteria bacterium]MCL5276685.1 hypothetical protein [Deltaproteobacteria bacterium]
MKEYPFRVYTILIMTILIFTGCPSSPPHSTSSGDIVLQGFSKTGNIVGNLVMASGDRLYIGWSGLNSGDFLTGTSANVYVSAWDGKTLDPLGNVVGTIPRYSAAPVGNVPLISIGMYDREPIIAMADASGDVIVKLWDKSTWNTIGDLKLADISDTVTALSSITTTSNRLYLAYGERLTTGSTIINVVAYDGSTWRSLPAPAIIPDGSFLISLDMAEMTVNPVIVWMTGNDGTGKLTIPVSEWDGTQWTSLSDNMKVYSSPWLMTMGAPSCSITDTPNGIAVMWNEGKPITDPSMGLSYIPTGIVSTYDGTQWKQLDDEVNNDYPGIATDDRDAEQLRGLWINNKLYVTFTEMAQVFLAYYSGSGFSDRGNTLNAHPWLSGGYMAYAPYLVQWNGDLYLSFVEYAMDQNTGAVSSNPVIREVLVSP